MYFGVYIVIVEKVESISELSTGSNIVYHLTDPSNEHDITVQGIHASLSVDKWYDVNRFLEFVKKDKQSISNVPDSRAECIFAFPDLSDVREHVPGNIVFSINIDDIESTIYQGDDDLITQIDTILQKKSHMSAEDVLDSRIVDADSKEAYKLGIQYWNSINKVSSATGPGEILISEDVETDSIVDYYN